MRAQPYGCGASWGVGRGAAGEIGAGVGAAGEAGAIGVGAAGMGRSGLWELGAAPVVAGVGERSREAVAGSCR